MDVRVFHNWLDLQTQQCGCDIKTRGGSLQGLRSFACLSFIHSAVIFLLRVKHKFTVSVRGRLCALFVGPSFIILLESDYDYGNESSLWFCDPEEK